MGIKKDIDLSKPVEKTVDTGLKLTTDLLEKPVSTIGNFLDGLFGIPADAINTLREMLKTKQEANLQILREKTKRKAMLISKNDMCEPDFQTASIALENAKYCDAEELQELFANLLSNSMNANKRMDVHPAFSEIIKQMSPRDARKMKSNQMSKEK